MTENKTISWEIPEYREHSRSRRWYIIASSVLGVLFIYSVLTANFLFAIILIIAGITLVIQDRAEAPRITFTISEDGIDVGRKRYLYSQFKNFWIYYEPNEAKMLFFEFKGSARPRMPIPLINKNPLAVRALLLSYLTEDITRENEPLSEQLSRLLKL